MGSTGSHDGVTSETKVRTNPKEEGLTKSSDYKSKNEGYRCTLVSVKGQGSDYKNQQPFDVLWVNCGGV